MINMGGGMLQRLTMQIWNDCDNAATVCNTGAEINMQVRNAVFLFSFWTKSAFALIVRPVSVRVFYMLGKIFVFILSALNYNQEL